jgi:2-polyprenyl-6-methoxyphenol hydroxylase-like FAD-dependent oxidoreductase
MRTAVVVGSSIAGLTVARLLWQHGWSVEVRVRRGHAAPTVVVPDETLALLADLWETDRLLIPATRRLDRRLVATGSTIDVVAQTSWTFAVGSLQEGLLQRLRDEATSRLTVTFEDGAPTRPPLAANDGWLVSATGRWRIDRDRARPDDLLSCGRRAILGARAELRPSAEPACWSFEVVADGWLVVAPVGPRLAIVQLMAPHPADSGDGARERLLGRAIHTSVIARELVTPLAEPVSAWSASPQICDPWIGPRSIRVGDAALAFDPISGDGTGHALRGAILAAAAMEAIEEDGDELAIRRHYRDRLRFAFVSHLHRCLELYGSFAPRTLWAAELDAMAAALETIGTPPAPPEFRYRLVGTRLAARSAIKRPVPTEKRLKTAESFVPKTGRSPDIGR